MVRALTAGANFMRLNFRPVFNKFFGFNTNFKAVTPLDDNGKPVTQ
jgi:hypothetical protein